jgi:hypothetical protein
MKHLKTGDLVRLTGYSRASIARMARGFEIPGTCAPDGVHFAFEDGADLRDWINSKTKRREKFTLGRPKGKRASLKERALSAGNVFHSCLNTLTEQGAVDDVLDLAKRMQAAIERVRANCKAANR